MAFPSARLEALGIVVGGFPDSVCCSFNPTSRFQPEMLA